MKMRTLRRKDNKEFASFMEGEMFTQEHPHPLGEGATIETLKGIAIGCKDVNWDEYEIVDIDYFEKGVIGADIRNKLTPMKNLVSLLEVLFDESESDKKVKLMRYVRKEMNQVKTNVEYLAKLIE